MNTQNVWIKRSEREPTRADYPVVSGGFINSGEWDEAFWYAEIGMAYKHTHWRSIKADPPARELTQRERDVQWANDLSVKVIERCALVTRPLSIEHTLAGIYAERREMNKLLDELWPEKHWGRDESYNSVCKAIRARLDEQGAK